MDLKQLKYFVHAAQVRSLTSASARAYVTQSALSRQIKLLEQELGVDLFERQARGIKLTEAGTVLLPRAMALLHEAEELKGAVGATSHVPTGPLRVGYAQALRSMLVKPAVAQFSRAHPKVRFQLREGTSRGITEALGAGEIDIALVSSPEALDPFRVHSLGSESLCWVGPPSAALSLGRPVGIKALTTRPLILTGYPHSLRVILDRSLAKAGLVAEPVLEADMASLMLDLVGTGLGHTVLPYAAIHDALSARQVCAAPIRGLRMQWVLAVSRERTQTHASVRAVQFLKEIHAASVDSGEWKTGRRA